MRDYDYLESAQPRSIVKIETWRDPGTWRAELH